MNANEKLYEEAIKNIPGGVNSPVRAFKNVGGIPKFIKQGKGAHIWDEEDNRFIDYVGSWGASIVGHANKEVIDSLKKKIELGLSFGAPTEQETKITKIIINHLPSIEKLRLVNSGTEATMSAIRLARGYTKRDKIIKFEGCYHGHSDSLLVKAGSGLLTNGIPSSAGVPIDFTKQTIVLPYNDSKALEEIIKNQYKEIAAVIIEPIAGNMNMIIPDKSFIDLLREITTKYEIILIYDEVMTGFRVAKGGAQIIQNIIPDITTLGKIIGGGMPLAAFGGKKEIMDYLSPDGPVYQAGTLSGNPIAVAAGIKTLELISTVDFYETINKSSQLLVNGLNQIANKYDITFNAQHIGGMIGLYFCEKVPKNYEDILKMDIQNYKEFFHAMLENNVYLPPSPYEASFISIYHDQDIIKETLDKAEIVFSKLKK